MICHYQKRTWITRIVCVIPAKARIHKIIAATGSGSPLSQE
jgi:hypothetical protein